MADTIVTLKKGEGRTIKAGGAFIYDNEIDSIIGRFCNGDVVRVHDFDGYPMGKGFINQNSKIRIRMLTRKEEVAIDDDFIKMRVRNAWNYRKAVMSEADLNCCRVIFGEADFLPGLVVDKYNNVLVVESLALGIDKLKEKILCKLVEILEEDEVYITGIYERSDAPVRKKEGMEIFKGFLWAREGYEKKVENGSVDNADNTDNADSTDKADNIDDADNTDKADNVDNNTMPYGNSVNNEINGADFIENESAGFFNYREFDTNVDIIENGIHYKVDVVNGQKTGFFLDQKYNRLAMQRIVSGLSGGRGELCTMRSADRNVKVLDCFTHMGTFALNCALAGAGEVLGLDISGFAVKQATENAINNGLGDRVKFREANVLDELPKLYEAGEKYDVVILDPPAFTKSKEATKNAIKGYREINMKGLKLVRDGGYFATCSCSHFMTEELLIKTIAQAAQSTHKRLRQIEKRTQAPDHPILWSADESYYLKFLIFQVVEEK